MDMEYKNVVGEFKASSEREGEYEGYFAITENVDDGGDLIHKGAFTKTLKEKLRKVRLLWMHDPKELAGPPPTELYEDSKGLYAKGFITLESTAGRNIWALMKDGALDEGSIGYRSVKDKLKWIDGIRHLYELMLFEISFVSMGMNPATNLQAIKALAQKAWSADGGEMGLYTDILDRITAGLQTVTMSSGTDVEAAKSVRRAMWLGLTALDKIVSTALPSYYDEYMSLTSAPDAIEAKEQVLACVKALSLLGDEEKAGRMLSGANEEKIRSAHDALKQALGNMQALVPDAAAPDESGTAQSEEVKSTGAESGEGATPAVETQEPEETKAADDVPAIDHSALQLKRMELASRQLIQAGTPYLP